LEENKKGSHACKESFNYLKAVFNLGLKYAWVKK